MSTSPTSDVSPEQAIQDLAMGRGPGAPKGPLLRIQPVRRAQLMHRGQVGQVGGDQGS